MICSIENCKNKAIARTWCQRHYLQWRRTGDTATKNTEQFFFGKVKKTNTCWIWNGCVRNGYGLFRYKEKVIGAHRFSYELLRGPIPKGLQLDHLCRVRNCVNPNHLEPVTQAENLRRGSISRKPERR